MSGKLLLELVTLVTFFSLFTLGQSQSLLAVLRQEGFTEFANFLEGSGSSILNINARLTVYAPTNAGFLRTQSSNINYRRDDIPKTTIATAKADYQCMVNNTGDTDAVPSTTSSAILVRRGSNGCCGVTGAIDLMSLLNIPEFVNLPPGNNASIVQKNMPKGALPVVHSGLGDVVKVVGLDIPFDRGIIRPVSTFFTLPHLLSDTLPFLRADKTLGALQRANLANSFDTIPGITFLAPDDTAIPAGLPDNALAEILKRHLIVGLPIFTSNLKDGDRYKTLGGTTVTVSIHCGDVFIGGAKILAGDAIIKNGVVHTVDRLLDAPVFITMTHLRTVTETTIQVTSVHATKTATYTSELTTTTTETKEKVKLETSTRDTIKTVIQTAEITKDVTKTETQTAETIKTKIYTTKETHVYTTKEITTETYKPHSPPSSPPSPPTSSPCTTEEWPKTTLATSHKDEGYGQSLHPSEPYKTKPGSGW